MTNYDIIVIGSGVNSLVAAAMMAKAGKKVLVLESREEIGGLASTNEFAPGFKCNTINDTIKWVDPRIIKELEIQSKDLELIDIDIKRIALGAGENELIIFHKDPLLTSESIANHSQNDAKKCADITSIEKSSTKQVTCEETGKYLFIRPSQSAGGTCMDFPEVRVEELAEAISTICTSMKKIQEADGYVYSC